jgi:hypothetical protein
MAHLTNKNKLLIIDFIQSYPNFSIDEISEMLNISEGILKGIFNKGYILIPSKMNKNEKKRKIR